MNDKEEPPSSQKSSDDRSIDPQLVAIHQTETRHHTARYVAKQIAVIAIAVSGGGAIISLAGETTYFSAAWEFTVTGRRFVFWLATIAAIGWALTERGFRKKLRRNMEECIKQQELRVKRLESRTASGKSSSGPLTTNDTNPDSHGRET